MEEEFAIQKVLNTYSQYASLGDWDRAVDTYLPDGAWAIPHLDMRLEGHEQILCALTAFIGQMDYVLQMNSPALIEVNGDRATAQSGIRECGKSAGKDEGFEFFGLYVDTLERTAAGWRFRERIFKGLGSSYFPLVRGEKH